MSSLVISCSLSPHAKVTNSLTLAKSYPTKALSTFENDKL